MATTVIATDIANYLASKGEGAFGTDIFADYQPDKPDEAITVFDTGGTDPQEPPEMWRELYIQVRSKTHTAGYEKAWKVLSYILSPTNGLITIGANNYVAQVDEIPSVYDRDKTNRYLFGFRITVYKVSGNITDTWLNALVNWTATALGSSWSVSPVWPKNRRPCVVWSLSGIYTTEGTGAAYRVHKKFTASILGNTPDEKMAGSLSIVSGLKLAIKILLDAQNKRYLTVEDPRADSQPNSLATGQANVILSRLESRPKVDAPLIEEVYTRGVEVIV